MRVALVANLRHPIAEPFAGGIEAHTHLLCRELRRRGHDVTLFASDGSDPALRAEAVCAAADARETDTRAMRQAVYRREHAAYLALMAALPGGRFDVVHNNSLHYLPVAMAPGLGTPMVTTLHVPPFRWLARAMRASAGPGASRYAAVSRHMAAAWGAAAAVDRVIPNGVDLDAFHYQARAGADAYLVWHGRIVPEKGLHLAIAAARMAGLPLRIAGPVSDPAYYAGQVAPALGAWAHHAGHLPHAALARLVGGACALLCTPMWDEPYGLVVAEALACGTPVAGFARGALPDILDATCGALAAPGDVGGLARAAAAARGLVRADCRRRAEAACGVRAMAGAYEDLYGTVRVI